MREVDESEHTIDHGVAESYQRIDRTKRQSVDDLLKELVH